MLERRVGIVVEKRSYEVVFRHKMGSSCQRFVVRTMEAAAAELLYGIDIASLGDPALDHCRECGHPMAIVAKVVALRSSYEPQLTL